MNVLFLIVGIIHVSNRLKLIGASAMPFWFQEFQRVTKENRDRREMGALLKELDCLSFDPRSKDIQGTPKLKQASILAYSAHEVTHQNDEIGGPIESRGRSRQRQHSSIDDIREHHRSRSRDRLSKSINRQPAAPDTNHIRFSSSRAGSGRNRDHMTFGADERGTYQSQRSGSGNDRSEFLTRSLSSPIVNEPRHVRNFRGPPTYYNESSNELTEAEAGDPRSRLILPQQAGTNIHRFGEQYDDHFLRNTEPIFNAGL